jgi:serine/threonine protein kinase
MSQRFIRCAHCGLPHDVTAMVCPATGKAIERRRGTSVSSMMAAERYEPPPPALPPMARPTPQQAVPPNHESRVDRNAPRDLTGKTIGGKYLVRAVLGEGGMGTVFEAENLAIGRTVAVKVLHPTQARKRVAVKRFHQEARAAGAIGHPNICEVYDLGTLDDGSPYLVMERLVGETLADRIASEGGLPFDDVIDVLTQVLSGLVAAHEKGIVHRDIKPENIFLTRRVGCPPVAKLLDFGVSKMISPVLSGEREDDLDLTRTGMVMGTPFYMSPEQARGDRNLDARVDLYACGVILYEALTGRRPYVAANYNALLLQILSTSPRPARELRPALPQGFDEVLDKSMARHRDDRFQSAAEFQRELQTLRDRHPKVTGSVDAHELARKGFSRSRIPVAPVAPVPSQQPTVKSREPEASYAQAPHAPRQYTPPQYAPTQPAPPPQAQPARRAPQWPSPSRAPSTAPGAPTERPAAAHAWNDPDESHSPFAFPEDTPSSIEIPVLFSETPMSGEQHLELDLVAAFDAPPVDDLSTEVSFHARESDTDTTERRADLQHLSMGKRPRLGNIRTAAAPPPPSSRRSSPEFRTSDTDVDENENDADNSATIVQSASTLASIRRRPTKPHGMSPDDTVRMDPDMNDKIREARERLPPGPEGATSGPQVPRAPKMPSR